MRNKLLFVILLVFSLLSCSYNFNAGVSGTVYEKDGTTGFSGVDVFAYTSADDQNADYNEYKFNVDNPQPYPAPRCLFRTRTGADGSFTVNKIVWDSRSPVWGKDDDVATVYLTFYHRDAGVVKSSPVKIVSGSTNASAINKAIERKFYTLPVGSIAGYIRTSSTSSGTGLGEEADDNVELELMYKEDPNSTEWKSAYVDKNEERAITTTSATAIGDSSSNLVSHGNYSGLGQGTRFSVTYESGEDSVGYVDVYIKVTSGSTVKHSPKFRITTDGAGLNKNFTRSQLTDSAP